MKHTTKLLPFVALMLQSQAQMMPKDWWSYNIAPTAWNTQLLDYTSGSTITDHQASLTTSAEPGLLVEHSATNDGTGPGAWNTFIGNPSMFTFTVPNDFSSWRYIGGRISAADGALAADPNVRLAYRINGGSFKTWSPSEQPYWISSTNNGLSDVPASYDATYLLDLPSVIAGDQLEFALALTNSRSTLGTTVTDIRLHSFGIDLGYTVPEASTSLLGLSAIFMLVCIRRRA